jgi:deazaflavin-dependent oxidoreductase (nitroreductase family)
VADKPLDPALAAESFCYVTTTGRVTGLPREIEIWFALDGTTAYLLSGGGDRSNWVRNMMRDPTVTVRIGDRTFAGRARFVSGDDEEDARARSLLHAKYSTPERGLERWRDTALPVAIDLDAG